jgi:hypothetical protein
MPFLFYLRAVFVHWWVLISCAAFTVIGIVPLVTNKNSHWVLMADMIAVGLLFVFANFFAWNDERKAKLKAEENAEKNNPKVIADFIWKDGMTLYEPVLLRNAGQETAANVQVKTLRSGKWTASFDLITYIEPRQHGAVKAAVDFYDFVNFPSLQGAFIMALKGGPDDEKQSRQVPFDVTYTNLKGERLMSEHIAVWDAPKKEAHISLKRCGKDSSVPRQ